MGLRLLLVFVSAFSPLFAQPAQPGTAPRLEIEFSTFDGGAPLSLPSFSVSELPICFSPDSYSLAVVPDLKIGRVNCL